MQNTLLILGASSDIGLDYIEHYHKNYDVIIAQYFTHSSELERLKKRLGDKITLYQVDLLCQDAITNFINMLEEYDVSPQFVLFLPARKTQLLRLEETEDSSLIYDFNLQVIASFRIIKWCLPHMRKTGWGRICFMLSSVTEQVITYNVSYVISKYALLGEMKALAIELASYNIMVNAVSPSMINTKFINDISDYVKKKKISACPIKRLAEKNDVSRVIEFLISIDNEYVTGENIIVSGGSVIR